jgi:hypothetical protein
MRSSQHKNSFSSVMTPSLHTLIVQPSSGTGVISPDGEASQGPSPVDYNLEIEQIFQRFWCSQCKKTRPRKQDEP